MVVGESNLFWLSLGTCAGSCLLLSPRGRAAFQCQFSSGSIILTHGGSQLWPFPPHTALLSGDENELGHVLRPVEMCVEGSRFQEGFTEYPGQTLSGEPLALSMSPLGPRLMLAMCGHWPTAF